MAWLKRWFNWIKRTPAPVEETLPAETLEELWARAQIFNTLIGR